MKTTATPRTVRSVHVEDALWRQRVIDKLLSTPPRSARLTFLSAPAGYGKSTTMAQFAQQARDGGKQAAWLSCDERDVDPVLFSESFTAALKRCGIAPAAGASLANSLAAVEAPLIICIDDFEQAAGPDVEQLLSQMLQTLPHNVSMVIASRKPPSHQFTRLQLAGQLRIVDAETLRFTPAEAEELLGSSMPGAAVAQISHYTDGWPFALQLARLRAESSEHHLEPGIEASGKIPRRQIFDYLAHEVLSTIGAPLRDFMLEVAVLDVIDADAANAVRGKDDSLALIRQLCNIRPIAVVEESSWSARLHPLLRDYLIDTLELQSPGRVSFLHQRAAAHLAALGNVHTAMKHAVDAGRLELAADIMEDAGAIRLVANEGVVRTRLMLRLLPEGLVRKRPRLHMVQLVLCLIEGEPSPFEADFERIEYLAREEAWQATPALTYDLEMTRCMVLMQQSEHVEQLSPWSVLTQAKGIVRSGALDDPRLMAIILPVEIYFLHRLGPIERCDRRIDEVVALGERGAYTHNSPWIPMYYARSALAKGRLAEAERMISQSLQRDANFLRFNQDSLAQLVYSVLGQTAYLRGDIDQATLHLSELMRANTTFRFEVCYARYVALSRCHFVRGEVQRAFDLLNDARTLAIEESLPPLNLAASMAYLEFQCLQNPAEAALLAGEMELEQRWQWSGQDLAIAWQVVENIARARYFCMLAAGRLDEARETALAFKARAHRLGFRASELMAEAMHLQLQYAELPNRAQAKALESLLAETHELGLVQPFVELGTRMMTVLGSWLAQRGHDDDAAPSVKWATTLIGRINDAHRERTQSVASKLFTPREVDVLYELSKSSTTKAIARNLTLSPETIKHHLKAIFAKLGVGNREDAIRAARVRGLI